MSVADRRFELWLRAMRRDKATACYCVCCGTPVRREEARIGREGSVYCEACDDLIELAEYVEREKERSE